MYSVGTVPFVPIIPVGSSTGIEIELIISLCVLIEPNSFHTKIAISEFSGTTSFASV